MTKLAKQRILSEIEDTPEEYIPQLMQILHAFREATAMNTAENSFRKAWKEVKAGKTHPVSELWNGIDG